MEKIEIIEEKLIGEKIIPSMVVYRVDKDSYEELICGSVRNNTIQYAEKTMFESIKEMAKKHNVY